ncbi:transposase [Mycobacterium sp.]|uniref:transposase n=1 Tax=Mycobacterium sp. TaxID=1785 RepID=UPI003F9BE0C6
MRVPANSDAWADLLRDCRRRGMRAPVLAVADGALGSGRPCERCSPTPQQRCWRPKQANVLAALPKSTHPGAPAELKEIYRAEDIDKARVAITALEIDYGAMYPRRWPRSSPTRRSITPAVRSRWPGPG